MKIDLRPIEDKDLGRVMEYSGHYLVDGERKEAWGNDRSDSFYEDLADLLESAFGEEVEVEDWMEQAEEMQPGWLYSVTAQDGELIIEEVEYGH